MTSISHTRGGSTSDRVLRSAARGGVLIGVAVVIGIVLLQVVGDGSTGPGSATPTNNGNGNSVTTTTDSGARSPQQVALAIYNASGVSQAANTKASTLRGLGYQILLTGNAPDQVGTTIACQTGFEIEATQLQALQELPNATLAGFPAVLPAGTELVNCFITLGK
jgi:hypothetical protein